MIRTRVFETKLVPEGNIIAITLFGLVFTRHKSLISKQTLNHELIHCQQQLEWLYIPFFILYVGEWLWHMARLRNWDAAYRAISFEREAYANAADLDYLLHRRPYQNYRRTRKNKS